MADLGLLCHAAIQAALFCSQPGLQLHVFGMNWSPLAWEGHRVSILAWYFSLPHRAGLQALPVLALGDLGLCFSASECFLCHALSH